MATEKAKVHGGFQVREKVAVNPRRNGGWGPRRGGDGLREVSGKAKVEKLEARARGRGA